VRLPKSLSDVVIWKDNTLTCPSVGYKHLNSTSNNRLHPLLRFGGSSSKLVFIGIRRFVANAPVPQPQADLCVFAHTDLVEEPRVYPVDYEAMHENMVI
jgi:hypothetical protein